MGDYCKNCGGDGYIEFTNPNDRMVDLSSCPACKGSGEDRSVLRQVGTEKGRGHSEGLKRLERLKHATRRRDDVEEA